MRVKTNPLILITAKRYVDISTLFDNCECFGHFHNYLDQIINLSEYLEKVHECTKTFADIAYRMHC